MNTVLFSFISHLFDLFHQCFIVFYIYVFFIIWRDVLFIIGDWNAKVVSQETPGKQENFAWEYRMKQEKD